MSSKSLVMLSNLSDLSPEFRKRLSLLAPQNNCAIPVGNSLSEENKKLLSESQAKLLHKIAKSILTHLAQNAELTNQQCDDLVMIDIAGLNISDVKAVLDLLIHRLDYVTITKVILPTVANAPSLTVYTITTEGRKHLD